MRSFAMLLPCGISLFSGVEFVCCPKHFKGMSYVFCYFECIFCILQRSIAMSTRLPCVCRHNSFHWIEPFLLKCLFEVLSRNILWIFYYWRERLFGLECTQIVQELCLADLLCQNTEIIIYWINLLISKLDPSNMQPRIEIWTSKEIQENEEINWGTEGVHNNIIENVTKI